MDEIEMKEKGLRKASEQTAVQAESFVKIYANNVIMGATNWDTSLTFGEIVALDEKGRPVIEQKVKVNMTREFLKALSNLLAGNVAEYEAQFGEIKFDKMFQLAEHIESGNAKEVAPKRKPRKSSKT